MRLFLGAFPAFLILWQTSVYVEELFDNRQRRVEAMEAVRHAHDLLGHTLQSFAADVKILSKDRELRRLASGDGTAVQEVAKQFVIFASEKPFIAQLRYLDRAGNEVVRVDRRGADIRIANQADLQNKADRYYFWQTIGLSEGALYVSAIDLNIENGEIELPWNAMLRLATPIRPTSEGATAGIVIVNISADSFIGEIERARPSNGEPIQLLNDKGYWLAGVPREQLWGFMFGRDTTLAITDPDAWRRISASSNGSFDGDGGHYVFQTLHPASYLSPDIRHPPVRANNAAWKIVATVPNVSLGALWRLDHLPAMLGGLLVTAIICLGWSKATIARRDAEATKRTAEAELIRNERLSSLGGLVAGVAHELNTPIGNAVSVASTLSGNAKRFGAEVESGQIRRSALDAFLNDLREGTALMLRGLERADGLIRHFKQVAVDQTSELRRVFQLLDLVNDVVESLQHQFKRGEITLETEIDPSLELDSFPGPLGQALMNLVSNARIHGFDEGDAGTIAITARALPGDAAEIIVRDTGKGIPKDRLEAVFEPFYSTRLGEGGSGLGLSIVLNIVTGVLGGTVRAESEPGAGTAMIMHIPLSAPAGAPNDAERTYDVEG